MTTRSNSALSASARPSNWLGLCSLTFSIIAAGHAMAQDSWDGGGTADEAGRYNWLDGANWLDNSTPTGGVLNFGGDSNTTTHNNNTANTSFGAINFTNNGDTGKATAFTLGGNAITLGGTVSTTASSVAITDIMDLSLIFNGNRTFTTASNHNLTINGTLSEASGERNLVKNGGAVLTLSNSSNSFSGQVQINSGTISVNGIADANSDSPLGKGSSIRIGSGSANATLTFTAGATITNRRVEIGGLTATDTGGATISNNTATSSSALIFTDTDFNIPVAGATVARNLTLGGSNGDANAINGKIVNNSATGTIALTKSDAGLWILSGDNSYTGINTISGGTLQVNRNSNGLGDSTASNAITLNGGTLSLRNNGAGSNSTLIYGSANNAAGYNVQLSGLNGTTSAINVDNLTANTGNTIQLGALTQATSAARTLNVTGANGYTLTLASLGLNPGNGQTTTLNPTTASINITGNVNNPMVSWPNGTGNYDTLSLDGTSTGNRIQGVISDAVGGSASLGGQTRVTKSGDSTWELNGANSYTGITTISGGKLIVTDSIGNSAVTLNNAGTILATDNSAIIGSTLTINNGAILAVGDSANTTMATATVIGATTLNNGSIFSWDINATGDSYDKLVTSNLVDGNAMGGTIFRIVVADAAFSEGFWDSNQTWNDVFTTNGSAAISNWAKLFGSTVSVVNSSFASITPTAGTFSISGSSIAWTAVPEPTTALAGLVLTAGLLRRRKSI
jgi:fibronectin-binding autotransporter adhesin